MSSDPLSPDYNTASYIHGYDPTEQQRLIAQADYWRSLICQDLPYQAGQTLLEMGCGVGAVLGVLGTAVPGLQLAGIDRQPRQIDYAHQYLTTLGLHQSDLRVGDAQELPWPPDSFDHLFAMWFLEHVAHPDLILQAGYRVLKPGGTITLLETDYASLAPWPLNDDFNYLVTGLCDLLSASQGNPSMGRSLGSLLQSVGFSHTKNQAWTTHYFQSPSSHDLSAFVDYVDAWLAPTVPQIHQHLDRDRQRLTAGLDFFRQLPNHPEGAITITVYRAQAQKPVDSPGSR